jgi:hypothetical protein
MLGNHTHRPLADLRGKLVRRFAHRGSTLSGDGASGKLGAVQAIQKWTSIHRPVRAVLRSEVPFNFVQSERDRSARQVDS